MTMEEVFAEIHRRNQNAVLSATWGHLAPEPQQVYSGTLLFALGDYGAIVPLSAKFDDLDDSPWFYEHMSEYIGRQVMRRGAGVYEFRGTYRMFKNGNARFSGKVRKIVRW